MKVTVHSGMTFQIGQVGSNQYARLDVTFEDVDPAQPLEPQLEKGRAAAAAAFKVVAAEINQQVQETFDAGISPRKRPRARS